MPVYVYTCDNCKIEEDLLLKIDHETPRCKKCGKLMKKHIQPSRHVYKGKGFYATEHSSYYRKNRI